MVGSLDLCSDGLAYGAAHGPRLRSDAFAHWVERFVDPHDPGVHATLDDLEARVVAVLRAIAQGEDLPVTGTRAGWVAQDLGQRLLDVWAQTGGDCAAALLAVVDGLAGGQSPVEVHRAYVALHEEYELPDPADVFAVGYPLDGVPHSAASVARGLGTVTPVALAAAEDANVGAVDAFAAHDLHDRARRPLGVRFATWLEGAHPGPVAEVARYEAALRSARGEPEAGALGDGEGWRLAEGVEVHRFSIDVGALAEALDAGERAGRVVDGALTVEPPPRSAPNALAIGRDAAGELVIAEMPLDGLGADDVPDADVLAELAELGLAVPARWAT